MSSCRATNANWKPAPRPDLCHDFNWYRLPDEPETPSVDARDARIAELEAERDTYRAALCDIVADLHGPVAKAKRVLEGGR